MQEDWKSKPEAYWKAHLTPEQYEIMRKKGTERAFTGQYDHHFEGGLYRCASCGFELFKSEDKFDSGCGWPAFSAPIDSKHIEEHIDNSYGMNRTEVLCPKCGGHLGHVFNDGPKEKGGMRYCINSASISFEAAKPSVPSEKKKSSTPAKK